MICETKKPSKCYKTWEFYTRLLKGDAFQKPFSEQSHPDAF